MFSNYFKTAVRNIINHKGYSIINIAGLAIGLAVFILIASFVDFHLSFDEFHKDADQIFSVIQVLPSDKEGEHHTGKIPAPLLPFFRNELPEITSALRWIQTSRWVIRHHGQKYYAEESTVWAVDSNFFSFFSFICLFSVFLLANAIVLNSSRHIKIAKDFFFITSPKNLLIIINYF